MTLPQLLEISASHAFGFGDDEATALALGCPQLQRLRPLKRERRLESPPEEGPEEGREEGAGCEAEARLLSPSGPNETEWGAATARPSGERTVGEVA